MSKRYEPGVQAAINAAGGPTALSAAIGRVPSAVTQWRRVPAGLVLSVERVTGVPRHELRPDLYPLPATLAPLTPPREQRDGAESAEPRSARPDDEQPERAGGHDAAPPASTPQ